MTHDELLAQIEAHRNDYSPQATDVTAWDALNAVVELASSFDKDIVFVNDEFNQGMQTCFRVVLSTIEKKLNE